MQIQVVELVDVLSEVDFSLIQKFLITADLQNISLLSSQYNQVLKEYTTRNFNCDLGVAHFHTNILNKSLDEEEPDVQVTINCPHTPCKKCSKICQQDGCNNQSCVLCLSTLFVGCSNPKCILRNKFYCVECSTNQRMDIFTQPCKVEGCFCRYHKNTEDKCDLYMSNPCKHCKGTICHIHNNYERYVDSSCYLCHRRACKMCWSNSPCELCP